MKTLSEFNEIESKLKSDPVFESNLVSNYKKKRVYKKLNSRFNLELQLSFFNKFLKL